MLPQFPDLQRDLAKRVTEYVVARKNSIAGPLGEIPNHQLFEGHEHKIVREDGKHVGTPMVHGTAEVTIGFDEFPTLTLDALLQKFEAMAQTFAETQAKHFYKTVAEGAASVGNTVDGNSQPFSAELYLKALDRVFIEFTPAGDPIIPMVHIHPAMGPRVEAELTRLREEPELAAQYDKIIQKKLGEWRAREASRELAG
jgi:hypothetical protein